MLRRANGESGMERIGAWAREIGPWRLGFGLTAIGAVYLRIGLSLAGYQGGSDQPLWMMLLPGVALFCALASGWKVMPFTRVPHLAGLAHGYFVLLFLLLLWGWPLDMTDGAIARPREGDDFFVIFMSIIWLTWATSALMPQGPRDAQR
jgi:hypothetical protein